MQFVAVIGGGASGMMAAITAARAGASVCLLDHKDRIGKKILSTGNGKCNFSNLDMDGSKFRSSSPEFVESVLERFSVQDTISFFESLGMMVKERDGYLYPYSGQASTVLNLLREELERCKVSVKTEVTVLSVEYSNGKYILNLKDAENHRERMIADRLILACGSKAAPVTGSDGSGYELAKKFGLKVNKPLPALVQLRCKEKFCKAISGVRIHAEVKLLADKKVIASDTGEVQLTDYGISGIPVFQVSRFASLALDQKKKTEAILNFYPDASDDEFQEILWKRKKLLATAKKNYGSFYEGWFPKKVADLFIKLSGIPADKKIAELKPVELETIKAIVTGLKFTVEATNGYDQAQICCGGVDLNQIQSSTMEAKKTKGLYVVGELLDADGICGGYNLQWAWSTGYIAGKAAAKG